MKKSVIILPLLIGCILNIISVEDDSGEHVSIIRHAPQTGTFCEQRAHNDVLIKNTHDNKRIRVIYEMMQDGSKARKIAYADPQNTAFIACELSDLTIEIVSSSYE
jgi:hypothetical protein